MNKSNQTHIFDRAAVRHHRARAASQLAAHTVLFDEAAGQLIDRLGDVKRNFQDVLIIGAKDEMLCRHFANNKTISVVSAEFGGEEILTAAANNFDLIISNWNLHWINDLPGALVQIRNALKPEGLFMAALPGGNTLYELRSCLLDAEVTVTGGASPRLSPTIDAPTASALLQRAGFGLPVTDQEVITLTYRDSFALMRDLRGMGETNAHADRLKHFTQRAIFFECERLYRERYETDGRIPATFEILFLHGWKTS